MAKVTAAYHRIAAQNRKARHEYFIDDNIETGVMLNGPEVKSLREGRASMVDAWAGERDGELWLFGLYIPPYAPAKHIEHESRRPRKLLVHRRERDRLFTAIQREGVTLVPLAVYFNDRGIAKIDLGIARGKRKYDKRETEKKRDWERQKGRLMRDKG